jgi:hypothetical protein
MSAGPRCASATASSIVIENGFHFVQARSGGRLTNRVVSGSARSPSQRSRRRPCKLDPADAGAFTTNAKTFTDSLTPLNAGIDNIKTKCPGAPVGYLVEAAALKLATPASFAQSIEDGSDPSWPTTRPWTPL